MSFEQCKDHPEPPPAYSLHQHACISLNSSDCLRFIRFPRSVIDVLRQAIIESWLRGIQREEDYEDAHEFKLHGSPWWGQGDDAVPSRILMIHILSALYNTGWYLLTSTHISKKPYDKDSLIFELGIPPSPTSFFSVSFNDYDKLNLICAPSELIPAVQQTLGQETIQREEWCDSGTAYHFKLRGNPWISSGDKGIHSRIKLLSLLDCFTTFGWKLYASIDMNRGDEDRYTDSWFFLSIFKIKYYKI
ncbi:unnamed protein product [Adineta steineri]|uniref:Uncharacterized protein n=1 Tax=Adineta steineri TaxID=433720 RepID=A0A814DMW0_9BILA|nr:unnamed protein product [Adineta steineri]